MRCHSGDTGSPASMTSALVA
ncbi:hypothetical protein [Saccharopolyspora sp. ASAGF58]